MPDMRTPHLHPLRWLGQRDRGFAALRRATRAAIIMPAMFALGDKVIGNPQLATYAAFGSFAMLLLADFGGPMTERLQRAAPRPDRRRTRPGDRRTRGERRNDAEQHRRTDPPRLRRMAPGCQGPGRRGHGRPLRTRRGARDPGRAGSVA